MASVNPSACFLFEDFALAAIAGKNGIHVKHLGIVELQVGDERRHEEKDHHFYLK